MMTISERLFVTAVLIKFDGLNGLCVCRLPSVYWLFKGLNWVLTVSVNQEYVDPDQQEALKEAPPTEQ